MKSEKSCRHGSDEWSDYRHRDPGNKANNLEMSFQYVISTDGRDLGAQITTRSLIRLGGFEMTKWSH
jgi:hypothetical protein